MKKRLKECRQCSKFYSWIKGIKHLDQGCCSVECFIQAGPKKQLKIFKLQTVNSRKFKKVRRINHFKKQKDFYQSKEWLMLRYDAIETYGRVCMACGTTKGSMHVDHIQPRSLRPDLELTFDNLQVLCKDCNLGKSNRSSKDFRTIS